ncbi:Uma2 family endonuclease [Crocosphaera sp. XPORK-15E]|uniref:Uma2 family endonuclease n=1 Tax=Crocosphaera sp. XPORK-15E TaxID=3110247 RepID=UPI002B1FFCF4|nr:Uma2 family endonuclease [Crocosphaera sp. XPORK-15E]MEA5533101.1 Uma2 family endonuclease [Crocosphaera sp. XPORK-15E]
MVTLATKLYSFEEYLNYDDGTDNKYELVNGELKVMPTASGFHALILVLIYDILKAEIERIKQQWKVMPGTVGVRTAKTKSRIPDLVILSESQCQEIREMTTAVLESPPLLAVEIVSPGNADDDYRYKRSEYAVREIPEYWIIDPDTKKVSILLLVSGFYEATEFTEEQEIKSDLFPDLKLTVKQIFEV